MKHRDSSPVGYYMIGIMALFMAGFLIMVVIGADSYQRTAGGQNGNMKTRAVLSYLVTCAKSNDTAGAFRVENQEGRQVLVMKDADTGYDLRIYLHEGKLVEDFAKAGSALRPEDASEIAATDTFEITELPGRVLSVRTDEGKVLLHMRSREVGV